MLHLKPKYKCSLYDDNSNGDTPALIKTFTSNKSMESALRRAVRYIHNNGYQIRSYIWLPSPVGYKYYITKGN